MRGLLVLLLLAARADAAPVDDVIKTAPGCDAKRTHCFGIALHVAVGDAGPIATSAWVASQLAGANRHFEALDTEFLNFANELKMENAKARQGILFRLTANTNEMLARIEDSGWHPALIKEMMDDVIQLRKRFVHDIMRGLEDE